MKLLIVDDNVALTWRLQNNLKKHFDVDVANTGNEGKHLAETGRYDAMILDLGLPDIKGEDVCAALRKSNVSTPILVLSAEGALNSKVKLLDGGADDYLTKPFESSELIARVKALVRRNRAKAMAPSAKMTIGDLTIDSERREVFRAGTPIDLRRKEFDILEYLARNQGTVVTLTMILEQLWDSSDKDTWSNTVRVHMKHLRDKIDRPFALQLIKTVRGVGYIMEVPQK